MNMARERATGGDLIIVALGGNLSPAGETMAAALERALTTFPTVGLQVVRRSQLWRSAAWPDPTDPPFLNAVALVETVLGPEATLQALHRLETAFGRVRGRANAPRTLDLDLVAYGREIRLKAPVLPHPRASQRLFVVGPLAEIAPRWLHPISGVDAVTLKAQATVGCDAAPVSTGP